MAEIRRFESGATRDSDEGKLDFEGFLSPKVLERFARYMHTHRVQADGSLRDSDNWQKGIPMEQYMKSAFRHFMEWWRAHREGRVDMEALCAMMFNVQGYMHESLKLKGKGEAVGEARPRLTGVGQLPDAVKTPWTRLTGEEMSELGREIL